MAEHATVAVELWNMQIFPPNSHIGSMLIDGRPGWSSLYQVFICTSSSIMFVYFSKFLNPKDRNRIKERSETTPLLGPLFRELLAIKFLSETYRRAPSPDK